MPLITLTAGNDQAPPPSIAAGDTVLGLTGNDTITAPSNTEIYGNQGEDVLIGGGTGVTLYGGQGNDKLSSVSSSILFGDKGNDTLTSVFADTLYGGLDNDSLIVAANSAAFGGQGNDVLLAVSGGATGATLAGDKGNDIIKGAGTGGAKLYGDDITLTLTGANGAGNDTIWAYGTDTAWGGAGDDSLVTFGAKLIFGNQGNDTLTFGTGVSSSIGVSLYGGQDDDLIFGNVADINTVNQANPNGGGGALLSGDKGSDTLIGSTNNTTASDTLIGGDGGDSIRGTDFAAPSTNNGDLIIGGTNSLPGADTTTGIDTIVAGNGNDTIIAGGGGSRIDAGANNDSVLGGAGADSVLGGANNDTIYGGAGNDIIYGGSENDSIFAGAGADTISGGTGNNYIELEKDGASDRILFVPFQGTAGAPNPFGLPSNTSEVFFNLVNQPTNPSGDSIIGFEPGTDKIVLDGTATTYTSALFAQGLFSTLSTTAPVSLSIVTGTDTNLVGAAQGFLVYYSPTGELFYNPDTTTAGFGTGGRFAILDPGLALSPTDFIIV